MVYAFTAYNLNHSHTNDLEIEHKRSPLQILIIELHFDWDRQFITAVHLRPSGQSRHQNVDSSLGPQRHKIILIEQGRTRSDKTQVARKNAPQLRQFVEAGSAKEAANRSEIDCWIR